MSAIADRSTAPFLSMGIGRPSWRSPYQRRCETRLPLLQCPSGTSQPLDRSLAEHPATRWRRPPLPGNTVRQFNARQPEAI